MNYSFWERDSFPGECDYAVIGAGIVGLNAAIRLKERFPGSRVVVLERGVLPAGASTKNAGFTCFGSASELWDDLQTMSEEVVFELVEKRWAGLREMKKLLGDENIGYEASGGFELFTPEQGELLEQCMALLPTLNHHIGKITGIAQVYRRNDAYLSACGFAGVQALIENSGEGLIHTGRMARSLLALAHARGVETFFNMQVDDLHNINGRWHLELAGGLSLKAAATLVAVNGFAKQFLPEADVQPARAQVLITKPLPGLKFQGGFHYDRGYYYFRHVGNRVLFGGGRNLDFEAENTTAFGQTELVQAELERLLKEVILPGIPFEIDQRWSGIMGVGKAKSTLIKEVQDGLFCAVRLGGMGVAIGTLVGREAADIM